MKLRKTLCLCAWLLAASPLFANYPGGTNGSTTPVTLTESGGNATMANGIVSIVCATGQAQINNITYTFNNSGSTQNLQLLSGGNQGGKLYWEYGGMGGGTAVYTAFASGPRYAEMDCLSSSTNAGTVDIHFSMLQGSPGFYVTAIWSHRSIDAALAIGETRDNIYSGSIFNWMSVDAHAQPADGGFRRQRGRRLRRAGRGFPLDQRPLSGAVRGQYIYSADFGEQRVWGWASVNASTGSGGLNVGLWNILGKHRILQRRPDEARTDVPHRHHHPQHDPRRPLRRMREKSA